MYKSGKIPPVFSVALSRGSSDVPDGYLALGGLAPVATYGPWASSKIQYVQLGSGYTNGSLPYPQYRKSYPICVSNDCEVSIQVLTSPAPEFYTITPDAFLYEGSDTTAYEAENWSPLANPSKSSQIQTIVSATPLLRSSSMLIVAARLRYNSDLPAHQHLERCKCAVHPTRSLEP